MRFEQWRRMLWWSLGIAGAGLIVVIASYILMPPQSDPSTTDSFAQRLIYSPPTNAWTSINTVSIYVLAIAAVVAVVSGIKSYRMLRR